MCVKKSKRNCFIVIYFMQNLLSLTSQIWSLHTTCTHSRSLSTHMEDVVKVVSPPPSTYCTWPEYTCSTWTTSKQEIKAASLTSCEPNIDILPHKVMANLRTVFTHPGPQCNISIFLESCMCPSEKCILLIALFLVFLSQWVPWHFLCVVICRAGSV